jgi:hypothetical protein
MVIGGDGWLAGHITDVRTHGGRPMPILMALHQGALVASIAGLLYSGTVSAAALTAFLSGDDSRRRAAREVLKVLLRRRTQAK